ncbi:MAG: GNAT family N-acetyltransferase [Actinomycetota bacterium]|nr:GNAT family N-acetyltransferase [Actinomycetota bacterium]
MIHTARLYLRPIKPEDKQQLLNLFADAKVMQFSDEGKPQTPEWVNQWVDEAVRDYQELGYGVMIVEDRQSGDLLGYCGLFRHNDIDGRAETELGYRLVGTSWGKGYATEAAKAVLDHAHVKSGLERVVAMVDPDNAASRRVAEKIGMEYEKDIMMDGYSHPDQLFVSHR